MSHQVLSNLLTVHPIRILIASFAMSSMLLAAQASATESPDTTPHASTVKAPDATPHASTAEAPGDASKASTTNASSAAPQSSTSKTPAVTSQAGETSSPPVDKDFLAKGLALATAKNCMACHQVDSRRVGPPFASVASRYGPGPGLTDYLAKTIREGGRGRWGAVPMPAQSRVSEAEAHDLARWILSLPVPPKP